MRSSLLQKQPARSKNKRFARTPGYLAGSPSSGASHEEDPPTCPCRPAHRHDWVHHSYGPPVSHRMLVGSRPAGLRKTLSLAIGPEIDERLVGHDHVGPVFEAQVALTVELLDLQEAHAIAHRALRVVVDRQPVRTSARRARDRKALGAVAGRDVRVELAARRQLLV